jgi:hypothetical protein
MPAPVTLAFTGDQHEHLRSFLYPGDGLEAVAFLLCGRRDGDRRHRLVVREIHDIPYNCCSVRTATRVTWSPDFLDDILERAAQERLSVIKIHSHPNGYGAFSSADDESDGRLLPMIHGWVEADMLHGSAVMLPDGQVFGRTMRAQALEPIDCVSVAGDDLHFWYADAGSADVPDFTASHAQAFDEGTIERLQRLSIGVVGASGTGSPTIEQLMRLGVGEILSIDPDLMEERNVNRILNSTIDDASRSRPKVEIIERAVLRAGLGTRIVPIAKDVWAPEVVQAIAQCDVLFGCVDSVDARYLLNAVSTHYNIPYFDIGIRLVARAENCGISEACGTVHYIRPGRSSLLSRDLFTMKDVAAAGLLRNDPAAHDRQVKDGYIRGANGRRPAVVSVNMLGSSLAVNELLARLHPFREEPNSEHAAITFSLASMELFSDPEEGICPTFSRAVGFGDRVPLLGEMDLAEVKRL